MPQYSGKCYREYIDHRDASKLVHCVHEGLIAHGGKHGKNVKAIELFVRLAAQGQQTYIDLEDVRQTKGPTGGLYPWLKKYGADILEQKPKERAFRIRSEFYNAMLGLFAKDAAAPNSRSILRLQGLGKGLWAGIDAQAYVNRERSMWAG